VIGVASAEENPLAWLEMVRLDFADGNHCGVLDGNDAALANSGVDGHGVDAARRRGSGESVMWVPVWTLVEIWDKLQTSPSAMCSVSVRW